jgi:hypothetical protein
MAVAGGDLSWEQVVWVGADEMNRKMGHNYLTVFVDWQAQGGLLAVEGKDAGTGVRFVEELGRHNGHPKAITRGGIIKPPVSLVRLGGAVLRFSSLPDPRPFGTAFDSSFARQVAAGHNKTTWVEAPSPSPVWDCLCDRLNLKIKK